MQNRQIDYQQNITLYLDESSAFNRHLLSLIKQWDKGRNIEVRNMKCIETGLAENPLAQSACAAGGKKQKEVPNKYLQVVDKNGSSFQGAEAVPIILKNLPFGKLAAAIYILPGTMWITKQFYGLPFSQR